MLLSDILDEVYGPEQKKEQYILLRKLSKNEHLQEVITIELMRKEVFDRYFEKESINIPERFWHNVDLPEYLFGKSEQIVKYVKMLEANK